MQVIEFTLPVKSNNSIHVQEDNLPNFYEHLHRHIETQITWVISGEGTLIVGNSMQAFSSGDIFIIGANQPHLFKSDSSYFNKKSLKRVHSLNIFFNPNGFIASLSGYSEMKSIKKFIEVSLYSMHAPASKKNVLSNYILKVKNNNAGFRLSAFIETLQVMANFKDWKYLSTESFEYSISDTEGLRMNNIYKYTMNNYTEDISIEQIASKAHLSPQSFCRYFKKHTNKTYNNFLNEVRINEACKQLMAKNFQGISNIAYQTGFNSVVNFNRVFKNIMKTTPREFIKKYDSESN
jgi:AraC-like DNA-binding protein